MRWIMQLEGSFASRPAPLSSHGENVNVLETAFFFSTAHYHRYHQQVQFSFFFPSLRCGHSTICDVALWKWLTQTTTKRPGIFLLMLTSIILEAHLLFLMYKLRGRDWARLFIASVYQKLTRAPHTKNAENANRHCHIEAACHWFPPLVMESFIQIRLHCFGESCRWHVEQ